MAWGLASICLTFSLSSTGLGLVVVEQASRPSAVEASLEVASQGVASAAGVSAATLHEAVAASPSETGKHFPLQPLSYDLTFFVS